jgi:cytochrome c peroxidase
MGKRGAGFAVAVGVVAALLVVATTLWLLSRSSVQEKIVWNEVEVAILKTLSIDALPQRIDDPSNAFAHDLHAVELGRRLFNDQRLSVNGKFSCASCHQADQAFTDGRRFAQGLVKGRRNTPTLIGVGFGHWFNSDGRVDSLWAQALGPLENPAEMGFTRGQLAHLVANDAELRAQFEHVFGSLDTSTFTALSHQPCSPVSAAQGCWNQLSTATQDVVTRLFVNLGKALAAYQATLRPKITRFDQFVRAMNSRDISRTESVLSLAEQRGLKLFMDSSRTACLNCHNGPMFTNGGFHDIGTNLGSPSSLELGRMLGARLFEASEFRCDGRFSDALPAACTGSRFAKTNDVGEGRGEFKVPTLRNLGSTAPYMHDGRYDSLDVVLQHYRSPPLLSLKGAHELKPLQLSDGEIDDLLRFLHTLNEM